TRQHDRVSRDPERTEHTQPGPGRNPQRSAGASGRERHTPALCQLPCLALPQLGCPEPVLRTPWHKRSWRARIVLALALAPLLLVADVAAAAAPPEAPAGIEEARRQRKMAEDLARATASDAATFEKAMASPELRGELERVLHKPLPPETLRTMAAQARAEADYWDRYKQGIERVYGAELAEPGRRRAPGQPPPRPAIQPIIHPAGLPPPPP